MAEGGFISVVPPLIAIVMAIVTRKAVLSLFLGIWTGGIIFAENLGLVQTFDWVATAVGESVFHAQIIVFTLLLGSAVAMMWRLGGSRAVRNWALEKVDTQRKAGVMAWVLGLVLFFDDYANTAVVGSTMKDISDNLQISREKLSYLVDSTAAPVATLAISSWVAFQLSMIEQGYEATGIPEAEVPDSFSVFLGSIPYNMYSILAIAMVGIIVVSQRDYGEMLTAERRAAKTGKINRDDAKPMQDVEGGLGSPNVDDPRLSSFVLPILVLVAGVVVTALWSGGLFGDATLREAIEGADYALALVLGSFAMVASTYVLGYAFGTLSVGESVDTTIDGFGIMLTGVTILVLAWSLGEAVSALGTGDYVAGVVNQFLTPEILPVIVFFTAGFIAFTTGSSWGTMTILTPIAIPVAWDLVGTHEMVSVMVGMIFSGAIFGDHCSPISDTTVLSSTFTGADLIDHVRTQLYYAGTVALVVAVLMVVWGYTSLSPFLLLLVGVALLVGLVYGFSELHASMRDLDPIQAVDASDIAPPEDD
jgi:Na+/H+ antiporter NhaC